jgi:hypothetical protein
MYFALNHLLSFFFQFHPFTIDFYVRFSSHSFNYSVSGLKLFIKLLFFKFIPFHLVFIWDLVLILLIVIYLVLNHLLNWFVFEFIPWHFIFISNMILILFIVISSCSYHFLDWIFFFNFIPHDLILFFCVKFGSFVLNLYFLNRFFFNLFFQVYP